MGPGETGPRERESNARVCERVGPRLTGAAIFWKWARPGKLLVPAGRIPWSEEVHQETAMASWRIHAL